MNRPMNHLVVAGLLALVVLPAESILSVESAAAQGQDVADEIFYQYMPIAWRDSDNDSYRFGDFGGMTASLGYLQGLGITAIWMNPIFPSPAYHGYQHQAADTLNSWFGSEADWIAFVEAAHARGIKVFVDYVAYGISQDSPWFIDAFGNPASVYDSWLAFTDAQNTQYQGSTYTTWNGSNVGFIHWDLRNSATSDLVTQWARHWLDPNGDGNFSDGLDGYRLDHVWAQYPYGPDGWGYNIDSFWAPWRSRLRQINPDVFVFAEQADWGTFGTQLFAGMDAAFTKPFEGSARYGMQQEIAWPLAVRMNDTVAALGAAQAGRTFLCTIGNHDVTRLATEIGDSFAKGKMAAAVLLTQPFPPVLYYGDEIGMRGAKDPSLGSDASDIPMREPMKWNAVEGPPMSRYHALNSGAWNQRISRDNDGRSVEEQEGVVGSLLETYRELIALRKTQVALRRGKFAEAVNDNDSVWSFVREHADQQLLVAINVSGAGQNATLDLSQFTLPTGPTTPVSLLGGAILPTLDDGNKGSYGITLAAYGYDVWELSISVPILPTSHVSGRTMQGASLALQNNATGVGDNVNELDQLFVRTEPTALYLGMPGNLDFSGTGLCLFYDSQPGGQNVLDVTGIGNPPSGPNLLSGLRFDAGFEPDGFLFINAFNGSIFVDHMFLLNGGGATQTYRGQGFVGSGNGLLGSGSNPNAVEVAIDNSNQAGVTASDPSAAATATTGFEMWLPWAELGVDVQTSQLGLAAFLLETNGSVSNQWLPGLGGGWGNLGLVANLTLVPGNQYLTIDLSGGAVAVGEPGVGGDSLFTLRAYGGLGAAASSTDGMGFQYSLPRAGHVNLSVYDLRGRRVITLVDQQSDAGPRKVSWNGLDRAGQGVAAGVYFGRLEFEGEARTARVVVR